MSVTTHTPLNYRRRPASATHPWPRVGMRTSRCRPRARVTLQSIVLTPAYSEKGPAAVPCQIRRPVSRQLRRPVYSPASRGRHEANTGAALEPGLRHGHVSGEHQSPSASVTLVAATLPSGPHLQDTGEFPDGNRSVGCHRQIHRVVLWATQRQREPHRCPSRAGSWQRCGPSPRTTVGRRDVRRSCCRK